MKSELILIGGGGHCRSCIDVIEQEGKYKISGIIDLPEKMNEKILGYGIVGTDEDLIRLSKEYKFFFITLGQIKTPAKRINIYRKLKELNVHIPVVISPRSYVSGLAHVGEGSIIMHNAVINANAVIGTNCIINTKSLVEHDVFIGDNCHVSTNAVINGGVKINSETFVGSCSAIREYLEIGAGAIIGIQAKVIKNVAPGEVVK